MMERRRFNVLVCGRRWGKTTLASDLLLGADETDNGALNGFPVAYMAPTHKAMMDTWREVKSLVLAITLKCNEEENRIELIGGGTIRFWSLHEPDAPRGGKYKRIVVDEAAMVEKLEYAWTKVLRPMLADLKGDAYFLSTPKGKNNYLFKLFERTLTKATWMSWQMPTESNPHIDPEEIEDAQGDLDPVSFAQEWLASFTTDDLDAWAYCYNQEKHTGATVLDPRLEVYLSFDFNRNPITCGVFQHEGRRIRGIEQIKLRNSNIYELCDYIRAKYGKYTLLVTGDATGRGSTALVQDNINYYTVIKQKLDLSNNQLKLSTVNPSLKENRVLVNSILYHLDVVLDKENCKALHFDLEHAKILPNGDLDKTDRKDPTKQLDALDCFRYYLNTFFRHILKM